VKSARAFSIGAAVVFCITLIANVCCAGEAKKPRKERKPPYAPELQDPLTYGDEFVEVTENNTLRRRYHDVDYEKDLAFYMAQAKANAEQHAPNTMRMLMVFCKDVRVTANDWPDENGKPRVGVYGADDERIKSVGKDLEAFADFLFAYSAGAIKVEWRLEVIEKTLRQDTKGKVWMLHPRSIGDQLMEPLAKYKDAGIDLMVYECEHAIVDEKTRIKVKYGGLAWTSWWLYGARTLTVTNTTLGMLTHEWLHHIFDATIKDTEGLKLTKMHPLGALGFSPNDLDPGWPKFMACYRDRVRYYYTRDMWRRWSMHKEHKIPQEPFSGKAYSWDKTKHDCWFKLPRLGNAELAQLTGLKSIEVVSSPKDSLTLFKVAPGETLGSPRTDDATPEDTALNNLADLTRESAAVLRTKTGTWLFVKPDLADIYVDMPRFHKGTFPPLPVYGYVPEGFKPLIVIKAPATLAVPSNELGYFKK